MKGWDQDAIDRVKAKFSGKKLPSPSASPIAMPKRQEMNKAEAAYSRVLDARKQSGEIESWIFGSVKLKLAEKTYYTPDFMVTRWFGSEARVFEFHEVKGTFIHDDAAVKFKVARDKFPWFKWVLVVVDKGVIKYYDN